MTKVLPRANAFVQSYLAMSMICLCTKCADFALRNVNKYTFFENK